MKGTAKTIVIVNPASANGRVGREWDRIHRQIKENYDCTFEVEMTQHPGHAVDLSQEAVKAGYRLVVALGGDGMINEVLNGLFRERESLREDVVLGLLPLGTSNDLRRTLGIPKKLPLAVQTLNKAEVRLVDVGKVTTSNLEGVPEVRCFLNVADFGSGGAIADRVNRTTKRFGAQLSIYWGIISTMISFENPTITFSIDGGGEQTAVINDFILANARYFGGGLKPAPDAQMDDGLFDIITLGDIGFVESLINLPRLKKGTHLTHKKARFYRGKRVVARANTRVMIQTDGEVIGALPATFEIIPQALKVKA